MRKVLLISSLGAAAAGACADGGEGTCSTQGAALLQHRSNLARGGLSNDPAVFLEAAQRMRTSISGSIAAGRLFQDQSALAMIRGVDVCKSCNACLVSGQCYDHDPQGNVATEEVCNKHDGIWCPSGAGKNVEPAIPPCESEGDFKSEAVGHRYCDFKGSLPDDVACSTAGCHLHMDGNGTVDECHCETEAQCSKLGGTFTSATCGQMMAQCGPQCKAFKDAKDKGSCDGISMGGSEDPLKQIVTHLAKKCCKSFPKSLCNPEGKVTTPCVEDGDFEASSVLHAECRVGQKSAEQCTAAGCHSDPAGGSCYCPDEESCKKAEGTYTPRTCGDAAMYWQDAVEVIKKAKKEGTCPARWEQQLKFFAKKCCKTAPKSVCNPTGEIESICKDNSDYDEDADLYAGCDTMGKTKEQCTAGGCDWHDGAEMCYCDAKDKCEKATGSWMSHSCKDYMESMESAPIKEARKKGSCDGVKMSYGGDLANDVTYPTQKCCKSKKSVCDK